MRPPASQESTMFWASCVCGPAAGPTGVEARWEKCRALKSNSFPGTNQLRSGRSKMDWLASTSWRIRRTKSGNAIGVNFAIRQSRSSFGSSQDLSLPGGRLQWDPAHLGLEALRRDFGKDGAAAGASSIGR